MNALFDLIDIVFWFIGCWVVVRWLLDGLAAILIGAWFVLASGCKRVVGKLAGR